MDTVLTRLRKDESGFGLLELVMAMAVLNIGILAMIAAFNSGAIALQRANKIATASVLADKQMELYRAIRYEAIGLDATQVTTADTNTIYRDDSARGYPSRTMVAVTCGSSSFPNPCAPMQTPVAGPDGRQYRVDTYVWLDSPTLSSRQLKVVTVVVRDGEDPTRTLVREQSTFDQSTGQ
jgi:Tfp pilus assembly protein PilE